MNIGCTKCLSRKDCEIYKHLFGTSPDPQHGREPNKVKSLAQYLGEYIYHELCPGTVHGSWYKLLQQALDAYESTENVKIKVEKI